MIARVVRGPVDVAGVCRTLHLTDMTSALAQDCASAFSAMPPWSTYGVSNEALAAFFSANEPNAPRFAICLEKAPDTAMGVIGLRFNWLKGPYIQFLGLKPPYQNAGLGQALLDHVERYARAENANSVWVMVSEFNSRGRAFYERSGFRIAARFDDLIADGHAEIMMRKRLRGS